MPAIRTAITVGWGHFKPSQPSGVSTGGARSDRHNGPTDDDGWSHFEPSRWGQVRLSRPPWVAARANHVCRDEYLPAELVEDVDAGGFDAAVLVPPAAWEGLRNDVVLRAAAHDADRFIAMVNIDRSAPGA